MRTHTLRSLKIFVRDECGVYAYVGGCGEGLLSVPSCSLIQTGPNSASGSANHVGLLFLMLWWLWRLHWKTCAVGMIDEVRKSYHSWRWHPRSLLLWVNHFWGEISKKLIMKIKKQIRSNKKIIYTSNSSKDFSNLDLLSDRFPLTVGNVLAIKSKVFTSTEWV